MARSWPAWPLLAWLGCWAVFAVVRGSGGALALAVLLAAGLGGALAWPAPTPMRRLIVGAGFPLSLLASGVANGLAAWTWLAPLGLLAFLYPLRAWHDAPFFPTPRGALRGLAERLRLERGATILDVGCGLGDALAELRREYPQAALTGIEGSALLAFACAWRFRRSAQIRRGDMWAADWSTFELVYLFQRPESMARAAQKAGRELRPGAWLASLEFEIAGTQPSLTFRCADGRHLFIYSSAQLAPLPQRPPAIP